MTTHHIATQLLSLDQRPLPPAFMEAPLRKSPNYSNSNRSDMVLSDGLNQGQEVYCFHSPIPASIFQYLKRTAGPSRWADSRRSYHIQRTREHLLAAASEPEHPRYWRPQILAFSNDTQRRRQLLKFSSWIEGGSGLTTAVKIIEGEGLKMIKRKAEAAAELQLDIQKDGARAFPLVVVAPSLQVGIQGVVQAYR